MDTSVDQDQDEFIPILSTICIYSQTKEVNQHSTRQSSQSVWESKPQQDMFFNYLEESKYIIYENKIVN